jgi:uncharacterized protein YjbJ (UPF0337 family)
VNRKGLVMSGTSDRAKGKIKEAVGTLTDDEQLKKEGKKDQFVGDAKSVVEDLADKADDVIDDMKKSVTKD